MTKKSLPKFQSFIVIGNNNKEETDKIAQQFKISLKKRSPDITIIQPEKNSISIDAIRELKKQIDQKPVSLNHKLVVIKKAQALTNAAQNSILKIFEEPPLHAVIILEVQNKTDVLPTILSRAIQIRSQQKSNKSHLSSIFLSNKNTEDLIKEVASIEKPVIWLDSQISTLHQYLLSTIKDKSRPYQIPKIQSSIEKCAEAKKMIQANVNPKFVLFNLILQITKP